jgi:hypothetical protein
VDTNVSYAYNGTPTNVTYENGRFNKAAVFNGSSSYIYAASSVQQPTTNYSVSVWAKFDSKPSGSIGLVSNAKSGVSPQVGFTIAKSSGLDTFGFWADGTSTNGNVQGTTNFVTNKWYHVVGTYDGSNIKIYVNGQLEGTQAYTATPGTTDQPLVIGKWYGNYSGYYLDGSIDQVRIYDTALTSDQVTELYNEHYQTKFTDGSDTAIVFTEGTGTVTFSGVDPAPPQGALRANTSYSEDGSGSVIEHYNGTDWKYFDAIKYCTTNTLNFPSGAGCIASYNLDNNVNDIGNTYNGVNSNVTFNASGKFGAAAVFNGSSSSIVVEDSSSNTFGFANYTGTASAWVNINSFSAENNILAKRGTGQPGKRHWMLLVNTSKNINFFIYNTDANQQTVASSTILNANQWYHIAVTLTTTNVKIYINGVLDTTASSTYSTIQNDGADLQIGRRGTNSGYNYFNGAIDQVRIFNDSLTSNEVAQLYNNEIACS